MKPACSRGTLESTEEGEGDGAEDVGDMGSGLAESVIPSADGCACAPNPIDMRGGRLGFFPNPTAISVLGVFDWRMDSPKEWVYWRNRLHLLQIRI